MIQVFKPSLGKEEIDAVTQVINSGWIGNGPKTHIFEKKFLSFIKGKYGLATNSASAALHLALLSLCLSPEDEVITPSFTFVATNHPILIVGATPVFCDVDYDTLCADPKDIEKKITKKTKVIIVVHFGGHPVNMSPIIDICKKRKIALIENCAHADGSYYKGKHVGTFGEFGIFSFAAIKNLTTRDGGFLVGKNKKQVELAKTLSWSGISKSTWERSSEKKYKWSYNVVSVGFKYQMNDIAAVIGISQLKKLKGNNKKRRKIVNMYNEELKNISWIETPRVKEYAESSFHNYAIKVSEKIRDNLSDYLAKKGVATTVHYKPTHLYNIYSKFKADVPVTEKVWKKLLLLPIFPDLSEEDQKYIINCIKEYKHE